VWSLQAEVSNYIPAFLPSLGQLCETTQPTSNFQKHCMFSHYLNLVNLRSPRSFRFDSRWQLLSSYLCSFSRLRHRPLPMASQHLIIVNHLLTFAQGNVEEQDTQGRRRVLLAILVSSQAQPTPNATRHQFHQQTSPRGVRKPTPVEWYMLTVIKDSVEVKDIADLPSVLPATSAPCSQALTHNASRFLYRFRIAPPLGWLIFRVRN
jgi:hypothetical protein